MRLFKPKKIPTLEEANENMEKSLKNIDNALDKYNKELNIIKKKIEEERKKNPVNKLAIENLKKKAAVLIQRKKVYENNKENTMGIKFNIDQVQFANESIKTQIDTCKALEESSKVLQKNIKLVNISKVEKLQDDLYDYMEESKEISEILGNSYEVPLHLNDEELDAELSLLEDSILEENLLDEEVNLSNVVNEEESTAAPIDETTVLNEEVKNDKQNKETESPERVLSSEKKKLNMDLRVK